MTASLILLQGEILVPYALMQALQPVDVERLLQDYGLLPVLARDKRWQLAVERQGYVLTFSFAVTLAALDHVQSLP